MKKIKQATKRYQENELVITTIFHLTKYKSFVSPHLDYGDVIYDQPNKSSLPNKTENVQYNAVLAVTGALRETSKQKLYHKLGLESLRNRK